MSKICAKCSKYSELYTLQKCKHIFCNKCLYEHVNKLESCEIKCPFASCNKILSDQDVRTFLSTYRIEIYDKLQFSQGTIQKCLTKNCPYIYISEGDLIFTCEYCEQPNCTKCKKRHYPIQCKNNEDHEETREQSAQVAISQKKRKEIKAYDLTSNLVPNFDGFECRLCLEFFLPRTQVILRSCQHQFCSKCLKETLKESKAFRQLCCPICPADLTSAEMSELVGNEFLHLLNKNVIQPKVYKCKYPDCSGFWDCDSQKKGEYKCPECKNTNCVSCGTVHTKGETCLQFKESTQYKDIIAATKNLKLQSVICGCGRILIRSGGCGALYCDNCREHICVFTGLLAGKNLPEGCGCSYTKLCHADCKHGCIPD